MSKRGARLHERIQGRHINGIIPVTPEIAVRNVANFTELYRALLNLGKQNGYVWASNSDLAEEYNVSVKTIERWISKMRVLGMVRTEFNHKAHARKIVFLLKEENIPSINYQVLQDKDIALSRASADSEKERKELCRPGYVYLLECQGFYKIGFSINIHKRRGSIQSSNPFPVCVIHSCKTSNMYEMEKYWHERFEQFRQNGEWFALTSEHVTAFCKAGTE